jgi:hypothetical protein
VSACVLIAVGPAAVVERTKPKHELFAFPSAALQNVVDLARSLGPCLPTANAAQIPDSGVKCFFLIRHARQVF